MSGRSPLAPVALAALAAGFLLLLLFEAWFTRALGVLALFAFVVAGVFAIATPELLEAEDEPARPVATDATED